MGFQTDYKIHMKIKIMKSNIILKKKNSEPGRRVALQIASHSSYRSENPEGWAGEQVLEQNRTPIRNPCTYKKMEYDSGESRDE